MFIPMGILLRDARLKKYAVPAPNFMNFKMARLLIDAASEKRSPLILAYGGFFLKNSELNTFKEVAEFIRYIANKADIPVALNLDHSKKIEEVEEAIKSGFTSVMFDGSTLSYEENIKYTKAAVNMAKYYNVTVEAEIGHVGEGSDYIVQDNFTEMLTSEQDARSFVNDTGVHALAVAIGTAHGVYKGEPKLDFERLKRIRKAVDVPLVLHGGSGTGKDNLRKAVAYGIQKINVFTDLINSAKGVLVVKKEELAKISYFDIVDEMDRAVKNKFMEYIDICGSENRC
jgi:ketose-bisphosphate aldolase